MNRDIERVIELVRGRLPGVAVDQLEPAEGAAAEGGAPQGAAAEDGLWFFRMPDTDREIAVESASGNSPFTIEHDDMRSSAEAETAATVEEAVQKVVSYLSTGPA